MSNDSLCLLYICLAIGAHTVQHPICHKFHSITQGLAHSANNTPSFDLCCFYYLQHDFTLRIGSTEDGRNVLVKTAQVAHDLGLDDNSHGAKGLHLYLIITIADQYCALTQGLPPVISSSRLSYSIFEPLLVVKAELQSLVDIVLLNNQVLDKVNQNSKTSAQDAILLEAQIGQLSIEHRLAPSLILDDCDAFYESFARIHMLYCRISLRLSMLDSEAAWGDSMRICCQAAKNIITLYCNIFDSEWPNTMGTASQNVSTQSFTYLPRTWRQIRRIFLALFVIVYGYCHGETTQSEALEYLARGRLLLDYQRCKWGAAIDHVYAILDEIYILVDNRAPEASMNDTTLYGPATAKPDLLLNTGLPNMIPYTVAAQTVGTIASQLPLMLSEANGGMTLPTIASPDVQDLSYQLADWNWDGGADSAIDLDMWAYNGVPRVGDCLG